MGLFDKLFGGGKPAQPAKAAAPAPKKAAWEESSGVPQELTAREVHEMLKGENPPALLDVREDHERAADGWIPGSVHIPMHEIQGRQTELDPQRPTVVYCASGMRSMEVGAFLLQQGFREVINLNGGIHGWTGDRARE